jgi:hypothetical protein
LAKKDAPDAISPEDFWERKTSEWRMEEQQFKMIQGLDSADSGDRTLDVEYAFEPANEAYSLYISQNPTEGGPGCRSRRHKCNAHIQIPLRYDLQNCQNGIK